MPRCRWRHRISPLPCPPPPGVLGSAANRKSPDPLDPCADLAAGTHRADAFGRAGEYEVARIQRVKARSVLDQALDAINHVARVRALTRLAVHPDPEPQLVWI